MIMLIPAGILTTVLLAVAIYLAIADSKAEETANAGSKTVTHPRVDFGDALRSLTVKSSRTPSRQGTLTSWIEQSGLRLRPLELISASVGIGVLAAVSVALFVPIWWLSLFACLLTAPLPFAAVAIERFRRSNKLRSQLPAALDLMSRMLRAGQTIPQSLSGVADEFESPLADEFGYCYEQQNLGLSTEASMYEMARRTGVLELRILVVALTIHRQAGGNLSELLDNLAKVIRERYHIQGQIRSLTADGRMQAAILLALPPVLLVVLSIVNQEYVSILFQFPWLLIGMFAFELLGALWLHRIVSFDF